MPLANDNYSALMLHRLHLLLDRARAAGATDVYVTSWEDDDLSLECRPQLSEAEFSWSLDDVDALLWFAAFASRRVGGVGELYRVEIRFNLVTGAVSATPTFQVLRVDDPIHVQLLPPEDP